MNARYYSPRIMRFVSADPIRFSGGVNWYAFAGNNPLSFLDPLGLKADRNGSSGSKFDYGLFASWGASLSMNWTPVNSHNDPGAQLVQDYANKGALWGNGAVATLGWGGYALSTPAGKFLLQVFGLGQLVAGPDDPANWIGVGGSVSTNLTRKAAENTVTLYRGVNSTNVAYADALAGVAKPNRSWWQFWKSPATPLEHNTVSTLNSPFTSWTTDIDVATYYSKFVPGKGPVGQGVLLKVEVPVSRVIPSPNMKMVPIPGRGAVSEAEVLLRDTVKTN